MPKRFNGARIESVDKSMFEDREGCSKLNSQQKEKLMEKIDTRITVQYKDGELAWFDCKLSSRGEIEFPDSKLDASERLGEILYETQSSAGAKIKEAWVAEETGFKAKISANSNEDGFYVGKDDALKAIEAHQEGLKKRSLKM